MSNEEEEEAARIEVYWNCFEFAAFLCKQNSFDAVDMDFGARNKTTQTHTHAQMHAPKREYSHTQMRPRIHSKWPNFRQSIFPGTYTHIELSNPFICAHTCSHFGFVCKVRERVCVCICTWLDWMDYLWVYLSILLARSEKFR